MAPITVGTARADRGERVYGVIRVGSLATNTSIEVPVTVINGAHSGPCLYIGAAVHGDEVNPIEVLHRVLPAIDPQQLHGVIIAVLLTNPLAFEARSRCAPQDMEDMNRVWPGKADGKLSERLAHAIFTHAIERVQYVVDLHTGATNMAIHVVYAEGDAASRALAKAFGVEILLEERRDEKWERARFNSKLRTVMTARGIPAITPELGGRNTFQSGPIEAGVRGLYGVLSYLRMLPDNGAFSPVRPQRYITVSGSHLDSLTATHGGLFVAETAPACMVEKGERIGYVYRISDFAPVEEFRAPYRGMVLSIADDPVMDTGSYVATLSQIKSVEKG
jgi:predicted deacylase